MLIRDVRLNDAQQLADIYNYYIENSHATFELEPVTAQEMKNRIQESLPRYPFIVIEDAGAIAGYAYGRQFRARPAYSTTVEVSVYLRYGMTGKGLGRRLYTRLLDEIRKRRFHTVISGISLPNDASVRLHEAFGFRKVAHFSEVGFKLGRWIDVAYWQLIKPALKKRRSK
jgi:phosphinothricin acetyltransferase